MELKERGSMPKFKETKYMLIFNQEQGVWERVVEWTNNYRKLHKKPMVRMRSIYKVWLGKIK